MVEEPAKRTEKASSNLVLGNSLEPWLQLLLLSLMRAMMRPLGA